MNVFQLRLYEDSNYRIIKLTGNLQALAEIIERKYHRICLDVLQRVLPGMCVCVSNRVSFINLNRDDIGPLCTVTPRRERVLKKSYKAYRDKNG